jgi:hypothetical protein
MRSARPVSVVGHPDRSNLGRHQGGFESFDIPSGVHPNAVVGTLDAIEAKFGIPILYTSTVRRLATERAASWLSKHFTYWWLEENGHGRVLIDSNEL